MLKIAIFVAGLVPELATLIHNTEQAWAGATTTEDRMKVIVAAVEDLLAKLRAII